MGYRLRDSRIRLMWSTFWRGSFDMYDLRASLSSRTFSGAFCEGMHSSWKARLQLMMGHLKLVYYGISFLLFGLGGFSDIETSFTGLWDMFQVSAALGVFAFRKFQSMSGCPVSACPIWECVVVLGLYWKPLTESLQLAP